VGGAAALDRVAAAGKRLADEARARVMDDEELDVAMARMRAVLRGMGGDLKKVRLGGRDFVEISPVEFSAHDPRGAIYQEVETDTVNFNGERKSVKVLLPYRRPDDKKEFPGDAPLDDAQVFLGAGVAAHRRTPDAVGQSRAMSFPDRVGLVAAKRDEWDEEQFFEEIDKQRVFEDFKSLQKDEGIGLRARQLDVFNETDWYGECYQVLDAHGWLKGLGLAPHIIEHVVEHYGQEEIDRAKERYGSSWTVYVKELAAVRLAKPLSRLWYAANMMSLYYIHHDDMRLGYLWAEYQMRLDHEQDSLRGKKNVASARDGGEQRAKQFKSRSQQVLDKMAAHVKAGASVSNAAHLAAKSGFGTSAEANRKLWNRHHTK
jgi:hypothetical protein